MLEVAQQLAYYVSFVDQGATSRLVNFGQQLASVAMIGYSVKSSVEGMLAPLNRIAGQWSQREQQINNITRSLRQYGYVGQSIADINKEINDSMPGASQSQRAAEFTTRYNRQFEEGRAMARGTIATMTQLAAVLPGEVNDYMQSFSQNLAHLSKAPGMTTDRAANISSRMTAGGMAAGISGDQVARDLTQFLTVGPHMVDRSWTEVWANYARNLRTHARLTASQITAMTPQQRVAVAEDIAGQLDPIMGATGDAYEALIGTLNSAKHELYLQITEPIFEEFKRAIAATNGLLGRFMERVGAGGAFFARIGATHLAKLTATINNLDTAIYRFAMFTIPRWTGNITSFGSMLGRNAGVIHDYFAPMVRGGRGLIGRQMAAHGGTAGGAATNVLAMVAGRYAGMLLGPWGALAATILTRMFLNGQLNQTFLAIGRAAAFLAPAIVALISIVSRVFFALSSVAEIILSVLLPIIVTALGSGLTFIVTIVTAAFNLLANIVLMVLYPIIAALTVAFVGFSMVVQIISALFQLFVGVLGTGSTTTADFVDALQWCSDQLREFTRGLQNDTNYLLHEAGLMSDGEYQASMASLRLGERTVPKWMQDLQDAITNLGNPAAANGRAGTQPPATRPHTNQDFRYSRFDITQRFSEGFSPDRVASAFASDLAGLAENNLQSGFQPGFSTSG